MTNQMVTNINVVEHDTVAGRAINGKKFPISNFHLHQGLEALSSQCFALMESESNNMTGEIVPRDVTQTRSAWAAFKSLYKFALDHNDPPRGSHETAHLIILPHEDEIAKIPNTKVKLIVQQMWRLCHIVLSTDSASAQGNIGAQSQENIDAQMAILEDALNLWFGSGADNANVGQEVPINKQLGVLVPNLSDSDRTIREPDADRPPVGYPDAQGTIRE